MSANETSEWIVSVETFEGLRASADALERSADALEENPTARGPAASLNVERGVLSATFTVDAFGADGAADVGIKTFYPALAAAGYDVARPGWALKLELEPLGAEEVVPA